MNCLLENRHEAVDDGEKPLYRKNGMENVETRYAAPKMDEHGKWWHQELGRKYNGQRMEGTRVKWSFRKNLLISCGKRSMRKNKSFSNAINGRERFL